MDRILLKEDMVGSRRTLLRIRRLGSRANGESIATLDTAVSIRCRRADHEPLDSYHAQVSPNSTEVMSRHAQCGK